MPEWSPVSVDPMAGGRSSRLAAKHAAGRRRKHCPIPPGRERHEIIGSSWLSFIRNLRGLNNQADRVSSHGRMALESFDSQAGEGLRCRCGCEMRVYEVRIDRRVARGSGIGGWERAVSYDRWVCTACGEHVRRPARLDPLVSRTRA